ncbi:MAG: GIY-YIG nuclease family protein [Candidatus Acidiferrales bacterium]
MSEPKGWFCYLLQCADGSYYSGVALDLNARLMKHNSGRASKYTRGRVPVRLVWSRLCRNYAEARALEAELKRWSRAEKQRLAAGSLRLSRRRRDRSG